MMEGCWGIDGFFDQNRFKTK